MKRRQFWVLLGLWLLVMGVLFLQGILVRGSHPYDVWVSELPHLATYASPGLGDLNADGVLDVVMGAGRGRFSPSDSAVIALDGRDGHLLWSQSAPVQLFGRPLFLQLNGDSIPDPVLHGRRAQLIALNGKDGTVLWRYQTQDSVANPVGYIRFNFYQPQALPDLDGDGLPELLVSNGGNEIAPPGNLIYRYPGVLAVIRGGNGQVMAADTVPDGLEMYYAPLLLDKGNDKPEIIFGTGGETFGGALYQVSLADLLRNDLSKARELLRVSLSGFIGRPVAADLNGDGQDDIVAVSHEGHVFVLDGRDYSLLWENLLEDIRIYSAPVSGLFNKDGVPDIFLHGYRQVPVKASGARQLFLDGRTGRIFFQDSLGCGTQADPLAFDADGDGRHEVLLSLNSYNCERPVYPDALHYLLTLDPNNGREEELYPPGAYKNVASTPWLGDMDGDGKLDIVMVQQYLTPEFMTQRGLRVQRLSPDTR